MKPCPKCGGVGQVEDDATIGKRLSDSRKAKKVTAAAIAVRINLSRSYLCDLERGRRFWGHDLISKYQTALDAISRSSL